MKSLLILGAMITALASGEAADRSEPKARPQSEARAFAYEDKVVDLLIVGPAARLLYDRLPGRGQVQACGASGLHKGDGKITCRKDDDGYACHIWLDAGRQTLAEPQTDDC
ncbi:hypothetical protein ABOZ73_15485 [Caulobacter sp. 73W]|uniref:Uncharacterized protein n=1 Tax=Caulobacter sp. 73W TaxID=3161137 RepID=A0AB39KQS9_9CAUL